MSRTVVDQSVKNEIEDQIPNKPRWLEFRSYTHSDLPAVLYGEEKGNNTPEKWAEYRAKKLKQNYCGIKKENIGVDVHTEKNTVYVLRTGDQRTYHNILKGDIKNKEGLKISENQFYSRDPKYTKKYGDYHTGLVVKISSDYDSSLKSCHNKIGIISELIDDYHYVVKMVSNNVTQIRDTDIKYWLFSKETDECFFQNIERDKILQKLSGSD